MTLENVKNVFNMEMKRETGKRNMERPQIQNQEIAYLISKALLDIQMRNIVLSGTGTITFTGADDYDLPKTAGNITLAKIGDTILTERTYKELQEKIDVSSSEGNLFATYQPAATRKIVFWPNPSSGTASIFYDLDLDIYIPGDDTNYSVDTELGALQDDLIFPIRYLRAVTLFMVGQYIDEIMVLYEHELGKLKEAAPDSTPDSFDYHLGGLDEGGSRGVDPDLYFTDEQ